MAMVMSEAQRRLRLLTRWESQGFASKRSKLCAAMPPRHKKAKPRDISFNERWTHDEMGADNGGNGGARKGRISRTAVDRVRGETKSLRIGLHQPSFFSGLKTAVRDLDDVRVSHAGEEVV